MEMLYLFLYLDKAAVLDFEIKKNPALYNRGRGISVETFDR